MDFTPYQEFIYKRTYARWLEGEGRREDWSESVARYREFFAPRVPAGRTAEFQRVCQAIIEGQVMPSMRALWTAGPALAKENCAGYNCAYLALDKLKSFAEMLYALMNGAGVGFSVERQYINQLPALPATMVEDESQVPIVVKDSKRGWAQAYLHLLRQLYAGLVPTWDVSKVRPAGARLKTFGGRASGPEPLEDLFRFTVATCKGAAGRQLNSAECHRIACKIAEIVVVGGVRRSACISLSNPSDERMRTLKQGAFWETMPELALANNSAAWTEKPSAERFLAEWLELVRSRSGERGIFNRVAAQQVVRQNGRRDPGFDFGCNPCSEIILRPNQFCNLSEVIVRPEDDRAALEDKARMAAILGVLQSTLTDFHFLDRSWRKNTEEERLLGVSLTGLRDHPVLGRASNQARRWLTAMRQAAVDTALEWAAALEINPPVAVTCVKPSGTVSQLMGTASGLHPQFAPYYIRRVRVANTDPLAGFLRAKGVPHAPENGQTTGNASTWVFSFPQAAPQTAVCRDEVTALQQLEYWLMLQQCWCEHKPSATIYVKDSEWAEVGAWVYRHWDWVSGISFLPYDNGVYQLAPYEEISESRYHALAADMPEIDFGDLAAFEAGDQTSGAQELACVAGGCEI